MTTGTTIADHRSPIATAPPQTLVDTLIAAFQHAALGVAVHGTTGSLLAANEAFHRMLGSPWASRGERSVPVASIGATRGATGR